MRPALPRNLLAIVLDYFMFYKWENKNISHLYSCRQFVDLTKSETQGSRLLYFARGRWKGYDL